MTATFFKHELRRTAKPLGLMFGITLVLALSVAALGAFVHEIVFFILLIFVLGGYSLLFQVYLAVDFYRSTYGQGAILTHTLPVSGRRIYWTRLLWKIIETAVSGIVGVLILVIALFLGGVLSNFNMQEFAAFWGEVVTHAPPLVWFVVAVSIFSVISTPVTMMFVVVVGSGAWARRLGAAGPVITYIIYYVVAQVIGFTALALPPSLDVNTMTVVSEAMLPGAFFDSEPADNLIPLGIYIPLVIATVIMAFVSAHLMQKRLEIR